jgi:ABC-type cobalamin/Fe3+-siderophores transport system ATPase subunit
MILTLKHLKRIIKEEIENIKKESQKHKIFVLVGPPSVGKSTWIKNMFNKSEKKPIVINRDDIVEEVANSFGWTYDDLFVGPPKDSIMGETNEKYGEVVKSPDWMTWQPLSFSKVLEANNEVQNKFISKVSEASEYDGDIVVDMTNMNANSRKQALNIISSRNDEYEKIAVVFKFQGLEDLIMKVSEKRAEVAKNMGKSKTIPPEAFKRMFAAFQEVTPSEGFDKIIDVDNTEAFKKIIS